MRNLSIFISIIILNFSLLNAGSTRSKAYYPKEKRETEEQLFERKICEASAKLGVPSEWLLVLTFGESRQNPKAKNKKGSASGIIQMTNATAKEYGTTAEKLRNMSRIQQIPYVCKFYQKGIDRYGKFRSLTQMKVYTLLPAQTPNGTNNNHKLMVKGDNYYHLNTGLDLNKNGVIHVFEISEIMNNATKEWRAYKRKKAA